MIYFYILNKDLYFNGGMAFVLATFILKYGYCKLFYIEANTYLNETINWPVDIPPTFYQCRLQTIIDIERHSYKHNYAWSGHSVSIGKISEKELLLENKMYSN